MIPASALASIVRLRAAAAALLWGAALYSASALGVEQIVVQGLFRDRAVISVDGKRHLLKVGERSPEGVRLIRADSRQAVLEVDGKRQVHRLGEQVADSYVPRASTEVRIWPNGQGMYVTTGAVNGMPERFVVDTGATLVAMNEMEARRLGIAYRLDGQRGHASTAAGIVPTYRIRLKSVQVGDIRLQDVEALVIEGAFPEAVLLGMSFLGRLKIENHGAAMLLRQMR